MVWNQYAIPAVSGEQSAQQERQAISPTSVGGQGVVTIDAVEQWGIDNTGQSDVSVPLTALSKFVSSVGGGEIMLRPGTYLATGTITIHTKVRLTGSGRDCTTIKSGPNIGVRLLQNAGSQSGVADNYCRIADLTFDMNGAAQGSSNYILLNWTNLFLIERCRFINPLDTIMVWAYDSNHYNNTKCVMRDCVFDGTGQTTPTDLVDFGSNADCLVDNCQFLNNGTSLNGGLSCATVQRLLIDRCLFSGNGSMGLSIQGGTGVRIRGCTFAGQTNANAFALQLQPWTTSPPSVDLVGVSVEGCNFLTGSGSAVGLQGNASTPHLPTDLLVTGCLFYRQTLSAIRMEVCKLLTIDACLFDGNNTAGSGHYAIESIAGANNGQQNVKIQGCQFTDTQGVATQTLGISLVNSTSTSIIIANNTFDSPVTTPITVSGGAIASMVARGNVGYNPVGHVTTPSFPATTVFVQNTTGVDVIAHINFTGVTGTHTYTNNTNSTTNAFDLGAPPVLADVSIAIPAGSWFRCDYTVGTPTWIWQGL